MLSTREVVERLRVSSPGKCITEEIVRYAIRRGDIRRPKLFSGRLVWTDDDIAALALAMGIKTPSALVNRGAE